MNPRTVSDILRDFKGRRAGILKALTVNFEEFYQLCDPNNPNLCLYGFPNQQWEVRNPQPSDLPLPRLDINLGRDTMKKHEWLSMVAVHSDAWLYAIASYFAAKLNYDKADKKRLFNKIIDVPSICEVLGVQESSGGGLPEHILVEEVLLRLPVRDLLKYRSVCRFWRSLIDDRDFVSTHLKNYKNKYEGSHLLVMSGPKYSQVAEQVSVHHSDTFQKVSNLENISYRVQTCLSYVNGLFLAEIEKEHRWSFRSCVLWNPSINRSLTIDIVPVSIFQGATSLTYIELGLGYDASCDDYKVIAIVYPHSENDYYGHYRAIVPGYVQVFKLSTDSWSSKLRVSPPLYWTKGKQIFANGAIHWTNLGPNVTADVWYNKDDLYVVSFDVENEVFNYFKLPSVLKSYKPKEKLLTVLGGSLALCCKYYESRYDIWVMEEYGNSDSWSKCYTFTLIMDELLHFKKNGELVFGVDGEGIKSYDVKSEMVRDLAINYTRYSYCKVFTYIESLVLSQEVKRRPFKSGFFKDNTPVSGSDLSLVIGGSNYSD